MDYRMPDDGALLRRYALDRDETAFSELVRRKLDFVYSTALRRVGGDGHLASDIAQHVFIALAREAKRLSGHPVLTGWLYTTTRYTTANVVRTERRRKNREQIALAMQDALSKGPPEAEWSQLASVLDDAMDKLREPDRLAVLLRCVERRTFAEIGAALSLTEEAARKRVDRVLEKLRVILGRRGVVSTASALAGALTNHAVGAAPPGLATAVAETALAGAAAGGGAFTGLAFMSMTKLQVSLVSAVLLAGALGLVWQQQARARLQAELANVRTGHDEDVRRLRQENARLTAVASARNAEVERQPAAAETSRAPAATMTGGPSPAAAEMRPAGTWQNRGRATPEEAWETLFWAATQARDHRALAKVMTLAPDDRRLAETLLARVPEKFRVKGGVADANELFAMTWGSHNGRHFTALRLAAVTATGANEVEIQFEVRRESNQLQQKTMVFRQGADGWQWAVPTPDAEHTLGEAVHDLRKVLQPAQ